MKSPELLFIHFHFHFADEIEIGRLLKCFKIDKSINPFENLEFLCEGKKEMCARGECNAVRSGVAIISNDFEAITSELHAIRYETDRKKCFIHFVYRANVSVAKYNTHTVS